MIDPHVHLRDWGQSAKETMRHGIEVAWTCGIDAVFDMPNTEPPLVDRASVESRLFEAERIIRALGIPFHYGVFCGATPEYRRLEELVELYHGERLGRNGRDVGVVGFKLYAGPSTGRLAAEEPEVQGAVYRRLTELEYGGVICVHCEKSSLFRRRSDGSLDWDPTRPVTFAAARPPEAEVESVRDQIDAARAAGFGGTLHIAHVSVPESVRLIEEARADVGFRISCEVTPHHVLFSDSTLDGAEDAEAILFKTNPPLRSQEMRSELFQQLLEGRIDFVASDHAPHTLEDKRTRYASGMPGLGIMHRFRERLEAEGAGSPLLDRLFHGGAQEIYGVEIPRRATVTRPEAQRDYEANPYAMG